MDIYTKDAINKKLTKKQDTLVSGTNIKTINGNSLLGSGNLTISGGGGSGSGGSVASTDYASANTQLNGLSIGGTNYKLLDVKVNDGTSLIIGGNRSLASNASGAVAIGDCDSATASDYNSTALGNSAAASGYHSTALGAFSMASGDYSTAIGQSSTASSDFSTALGQRVAVYVPNWVGFDGTSDDYVRTLALKSTDNVFFRNENVDSTKTTQASYTSGKTLTQVLNEKQDTLVSYKQTFNVNGSEWGVCYKGINEMLKEDDVGKPANINTAPLMKVFKSWQLNGVDVVYPKQITGANSYSARFESFYIDSDIADMSWDEIITLAKNKVFDSTYLGQTKQLDIGGVAYTVQIIGVNHDDSTDGTGKANLTFQLKYLLADYYAMNATSTCDGGWEATAMRTNVLPNILSQMPTNIQKAIKSVNKANCKDYDIATITYTSDKLFLLSEAEVSGVKENAAALEGTQYEYWANNNTKTAKIKYKGEGGTDAYYWWLRSPTERYAGFCRVDTINGSGSYVDGGLAIATYGVSFAFDL